jgi:type VI secretion system protein ImpJ
MTELAGALTTFSSTIRPRDLPLYDHDDLGNRISMLDAKLRSLLETVVPTSVVSLPLKLVQPSIYGTALDDEKYLKDTRMFLAISTGNSEEELIRKAPQLLKLCSATHIAPFGKAVPSGDADHARDEPTQRDSGETQIAVLQPEPVRTRVGSGAPRAELRRVRARESSQS